MPKKFEIVHKSVLNAEMSKISVYAPWIAEKAKPGQFIILRSSEEAERIPLTISSHDNGLVTVIFQKVGAGTMALDLLNEGDCLADMAGPLGKPTPVEDFGRVAVLGGGLGCAIALPVARGLHQAGNQVDLIAGFRNKERIILQDEMKAACTDLHTCTDDGSFGFHGFVTNKLEELIQGGVKFNQVFAIGPLPMMKFATLTAKKYGIPCMISMCPLMIDGTGMCGCCRVNVGGETKFACVDGPDFDGYLVDFDEAIERNRTYKSFEDAQRQKEAEHICHLTGEVRK